MEVCSADEERFRKVVLVNPISKSASKDLRRLVEKGADGLRVNLQLNSIETWENEEFLGLVHTAQVLEIPICFQLTLGYYPLIRSLAIQFGKTTFILDHLGRPQKGSRPKDELFINLLKLAEFNNLFIKLSGLNYYSEKTKPYRDTWSLLHAAKEAYSAKRCMWGSDYPFVNDHWSYEENLETFRNKLGFSESDLGWILGKTAETIWWSA